MLLIGISAIMDSFSNCTYDVFSFPNSILNTVLFFFRKERFLPLLYNFDERFSFSLRDNKNQNDASADYTLEMVQVACQGFSTDTDTCTRFR